MTWLERMAWFVAFCAFLMGVGLVQVIRPPGERTPNTYLCLPPSACEELR